MRTADFPIPMDKQELMSVRTPWLTFKFLDPVECLFRLLIAGPLSADMANMAFRPRLQHPWYAYYCGDLGCTVFCCVLYLTCISRCLLRYEDFVDGERVKRIYAALQPGLSALTGVLFFDSINRDKKGCRTLNTTF